MHQLQFTRSFRRPTLLTHAAGLALGVACLAPGALAQLAPAGSEDAHAMCGHAKTMERRFLMQQAGESYGAEDPVGACLMCETAGETDVLNCNLDIELVPGTSSITGSNTFTIKVLSGGISQFTFRLASDFSVSSAVINGTTTLGVSQPSSTTRIANLDRVYTTGEVFTLTISYTGVATTGSSSGFGSITFSTQNGQPLITSLSEPYYAYTWWPCKDGDLAVSGDNSDKFTAQVAITVPNTLKAVSNGLLQGVDAVPLNKSKYRWASNYPISTYLVCVAATNYTQWSVNYTPLAGGTMPVQFSIYPANDTAGNRAVWQLTPSMMTAYRGVYGEYPFVNEKYGIYQFPFSGGMEHQTYTGQGSGGAFSESVTSHELGHQWWGDNVTCKTWNDIWLNEGFATYTECIWQERKTGTPTLSALQSAINARKPSAVTGTVYRTDVTSVASIFSSTYSYNKGAWVLHMLRHVMSNPTLTYPNNDALFFTGLQNYRAQFQGGSATTLDFQNSMSATAGQDLSWFFNEWVFNGGAPAYAAGWQTFSSGGQNYLRLSLRQTQASPIFRMPVDVRITTGGGTLTSVVTSDASTDWFVIPIPAAATAVSIDPDGWILTTAATLSESYRAGPAKVIQATPTPGATLATPPASLSVVFSENVNIPAGAITLVGPSGSVPVTTTYNATTFTATVTPNSPLPGGATYTLTAPATITSVTGGAALDGELGPVNAPFPTGNGNAGGNASWTFTVQPQAVPCYANCDGSTDVPVLSANDFACFLTKFRAGDPTANCDGSTDVPALTAADFSCFLAKFRAGCP